MGFVVEVGRYKVSKADATCEDDPAVVDRVSLVEALALGIDIYYFTVREALPRGQ